MRSNKTMLCVTFVLSLLIIGYVMSSSAQNLNAASENFLQTTTGSTNLFMPLAPHSPPPTPDSTSEGVQDFTCTNVSEIPQIECEALVAIADADPDSFIADQWLANDTPCTWRKVTCADGRVSELNLELKDLTSVPSEIGNLTALTALNLDNNRLTNLPPEIGNLTALTSLNLGNNRLTNLPPEIGNLTALTELSLQYNQLTSLPPEIGNLTALTWLFLYNNQLTNLPPEIGNLTALTSLSLQYNQLTSLPSEIGNLTALTSLDLNDNSQLTSLPPEIGNLTALIYLGLSFNNLTSLPPEIGNLTALTYLDLHYSQLTSLPSEIGNLTALTRLDLQYNQLTSLPSEIGTLTTLTRLDLSDNGLTSLPSEIGNLTALTDLDLDYNDLTSLPSEIGNLTALTWLDLRNNQLTSLPPELDNLTQLQTLLTEGNPLTPVTPNTIDENTASDNSLQASIGGTNLLMPLAFHPSPPRVLDITSEDVQLITIAPGGSMGPSPGIWYLGPAQQFFNFSEQNAVMTVRFNIDDFDFNPTISINLFSATENAEAIGKWVQNQYSDVFFDDASEPIYTVILDQANLSITNPEFLGQTEGWYLSDYDNYSVQYSVSP